MQHEAYIQTLRNAFKITDKSLTFLKDTSKIIDHIEKTPVRGGKPPSINTLKTYFTHIVSVLRDSGGDEMKPALEKYRERMMEYRDKHTEFAKTQQTTPAEEKKWNDWQTIIKTREALKEKAKDHRTFQKYLIVCLYTMIEPQRLDYSPMLFVDEIPATEEGRKYNICLLTPLKATFYFREYKSDKTFGARMMPVPHLLFEVLTKWRSYNKSKWLLTKADQETPLTEATLGQKIQSIFEDETGKPTSVDILRHAYITEKRKNEMSLQEKERLAWAMGHSTSTNEMYRRMIDRPASEEKILSTNK